MPDIYGKNTKYGNNVLTTTNTMKLIASNGGDMVEYLVQQVAIQYNQPLNRIYEIGSDFVYFAPGRAVGSCQIGRIIGETLITDLLGNAGEGMWKPGTDADDHTMIFTDNGDGSFESISRVHYKLTGCIVESYSVAGDANGMLMQENVTIQFAGLSFAGV